jgi:arginine repressor
VKSFLKKEKNMADRRHRIEQAIIKQYQIIQTQEEIVKGIEENAIYLNNILKSFPVQKMTERNYNEPKGTP